MNTLSNLIIPPYKFNKLNSSLSRGSYPKPKNFKFLKRLRLTTLISLIPKEPENYLREWCENNNVELISFQVQKPKENIPLSFSKIGQIIQTIVDRLDGNVYIHCLDGELVTGIVCACYRKLELWSLNNCLFEFARYIILYNH
ncbi:hypothetical protein CONCODRAFT_42384 [Conidiobolus coronatus NRRL 28638]|uniref:Protein-tyrosine-phosphatase n=1 Tax=Conidiobolus coronatus (strain ATCC 28846 / CBS 209.66 / NRRL 28638) TaxID=796925 RepID=A0A137NYL2_CONC2|nr:hypothetical protein CONCODRAFT_42384 [Conidiobolus coronatus NRRL 28638]|eukprot:KXN67866.1 hypothetical protein CONCODRAFT_42384 [Conidiobolus coronatus NRRL 28638]